MELQYFTRIKVYLFRNNCFVFSDLSRYGQNILPKNEKTAEKLKFLCGFLLDFINILQSGGSYINILHSARNYLRCPDRQLHWYKHSVAHPE